MLIIWSTTNSNNVSCLRMFYRFSAIRASLHFLRNFWSSLCYCGILIWSACWMLSVTWQMLQRPDRVVLVVFLQAMVESGFPKSPHCHGYFELFFNSMRRVIFSWSRLVRLLCIPSLCSIQTIVSARVCSHIVARLPWLNSFIETGSWISISLFLVAASASLSTASFDGCSFSVDGCGLFPEFVVSDSVIISVLLALRNWWRWDSQKRWLSFVILGVLRSTGVPAGLLMLRPRRL